MTEGCLVLTCQGGAWKASLTTSQCCFEGETYPTNTTITSTMSQDKCVKADVVCVEGEDGKAKTDFKMETYCEAKNKNTGCQEKGTGNKLSFLRERALFNPLYANIFLLVLT